MADSKKPDPDQYSEEEAERRFRSALGKALTTPPQPLKDVPKKRGNKRSTQRSETRPAKK